MNSITIYTGNLAKIKVKKNSLELTPTVEKELVKLLEAKDRIDGILEQLKDTFGDAMEQANTNLVERGDIKITRSVTGRRFSFDPKKTVKPEFTQTTSYQQPNVEMIDAYVTLKGKVPAGIVENARKAKVDIKLHE